MRRSSRKSRHLHGQTLGLTFGPIKQALVFPCFPYIKCTSNERFPPDERRREEFHTVPAALRTVSGFASIIQKQQLWLSTGVKDAFDVQQLTFGDLYWMLAALLFLLRRCIVRSLIVRYLRSVANWSIRVGYIAREQLGEITSLQEQMYGDDNIRLWP